MTKKFRIPGHEIKPLALGRGSCIASDEVTCDGKPVGFMYREAPDNETDSGWRFLSGDETEDTLAEPRNFELYDVNTIANYDPAIIPLLDSPVMSAFERDADSGTFAPVSFPVSGLQ